MTQDIKDKRVLLIICGGIAAYKSLELIRLLRKEGANVTCLMTKAAEEFITPLSVAALSENEVHTNLWSLEEESKMRHIRLTREADLIVIAPASANLLAKMANGLADDLASTTLLASDKPALIAPAMNHMMWNNPATQENIAKLKDYGHTLIGPEDGDMACGERGIGRMSEPEDIVKQILQLLTSNLQHLKGRKALVTSGPTFEPIDPVRFIGNRSSGKQGHAIAAALSKAGADVTLITGPVALPDPQGVRTIHIETAAQMLETAKENLPADIAICAAAVSDWSADSANHKIKKREDGAPPAIALKENPDILRTLATHKNRPQLVIGFAAETENLLENAAAKLKRKNCDFLLANLVQSGEESVFGHEQNHVYLIDKQNSTDWGKMDKTAIAAKLTNEIAKHFEREKGLKDAAE